MKRWIEISAVAAGLVLATAGTASAGEATGNGKPTPAPGNAASECVFSGQDTQDASARRHRGATRPMFDDDALAVRGNQSPGGVDRYHGVQNYGIFVRAGLKDVVPSPGDGVQRQRRLTEADIRHAASLAQRKPMLPAEDSAVLEERAATR